MKLRNVRRVGSYAFASRKSLFSLTLSIKLAKKGICFQKLIPGQCGAATCRTIARGWRIQELRRTLSPGVARVCWSAFEASALKELTLPAGATRVGERAFSGCASLTALLRHTPQAEAVEACSGKPFCRKRCFVWDGLPSEIALPYLRLCL